MKFFLENTDMPYFRRTPSKKDKELLQKIREKAVGYKIGPDGVTRVGTSAKVTQEEIKNRLEHG